VSVESDAWAGWRNAEVYDRFVRERSVYRKLNRVLIELADVGGADRVLDLGCGTGATAAAALAVMPAHGTLVGLDASEAMVEVARLNNQDPRATFHPWPAEQVGERLEEPFDRVVCNAALWQFTDLDRVVRAVAGLLRRGGSFVFNVPADRVQGGEPVGHGLQVTVARVVEEVLGEPYRSEAVRFDLVALDRMLVEAGLGSAHHVDHVLECTREEMLDLLAIPAIGGPMMHGLEDNRLEDVVQRLRARGDGEERVHMPWLYFVARRPG
jgi:SAM-dependent methyltransferase